MIQTDEIEELDISDILNKKLIVHNDDVTPFGLVIQTLIEVCGHSLHQAEQCTLIIHHKGQCCVKEGLLNDLKLMKDLISSRGILVTIE